MRLLAETHLAEVSLQYREETSQVDKSGFWWLLIPVIAVGLGIAIYKWWDRPPAIVNTPRGMMLELCRAHHLGGRARRLLDRICEQADLEQPATIFVGTTQFEAAVQQAAKRRKFDRRDQITLAMLRRRLFA